MDPMRIGLSHGGFEIVSKKNHDYEGLRQYLLRLGIEPPTLPHCHVLGIAFLTIGIIRMENSRRTNA